MSPSQESITVERNGNTVVVYRGDMSDAEWSALKQEHMPAPSVKKYGNDQASKNSADAAAEPLPEESTADALVRNAKDAASSVRAVLAKPGQALDAIDDSLASGLQAGASAIGSGVQKGVSAVGGAIADTVLPDKGPPAAPLADPVDSAGGPPPMPAAESPPAQANVTDSAEVAPSMAPAPSRPFNLAPNDEQHQLVEGYKTQSTAMAAAADLQSQEMKQRALLMQQAQDEDWKLQQRASTYQAAQAQRLQQAQDGYAALQAKYAQMEKEVPNPNRFWGNTSNGDKAFAILQGALFGFGGQGSQWLQHIDSLVAQDIALQTAQLGARRDLVDRQVKVQGNIVELAMQQGLSENEAVAAARASAKESLARRVEMLAANSGSELVKAQAAEKIGGLQISAAKDKAVLQQHAQSQATERGRLEVERFNAQTRRMETLGQIQARAAPKKLDLTSAESERLVATQAAWDALPALQSAVGSGKVGEALLDQLQKNFPGTNAANRDQQAKLLGRIIFAGIDKSVVNAADQEFLDKLQSGVGLRSMSQGDIPAFKRLVKASHDAALKVAKQRQEGTLAPLEEHSLKTERPLK